MSPRRRDHVTADIPVSVDLLKLLGPFSPVTGEPYDATPEERRMPEPQDARPKWLDPNAQDAVPDGAAVPDAQERFVPRLSPDVRAAMDTWQREADVRARQRERTREHVEGADPEAMVLRELIAAEEFGSREAQQLHATRAAAWASLAVLRELRMHHRTR